MLLYTFIAYLGRYKKSNIYGGLDRPRGLQKVEVPSFQDTRHVKVARLSALRTGRLYPPPISRPLGQSEAGSINSMKNPNDPIGNQNPDLPAGSAVPQ